MDATVAPTDDLPKRLRTLERRQRWLAAFLALFVGLALVGAVPSNPTVMWASELQITGTDKKGRAILTSHQGGSDFWLFDGKGNSRIAMSVPDKGGPSISLHDANGKPAIVISERGVKLWHEGKTKAYLFAEDGESGLFFQDGDEAIRAGIGVRKDGTGEIEVLEPKGKRVWGMPAE